MDLRKTHLVWLTPLWIAFSSGCGSEEEAPLADGLHLRYQWNFVGDVLFVDVTVKKVDDEHFLLEIKTEKDGETGEAEVRVDRFFKTESGELAGLAEQPFWLPSSKRKKGAEVVADGSISMRKERKWDRWNVWMAGGGAVIGTVNWYFEKETGFLVGSYAESMGSGISLKLLETNVPGL